MYTHIITHALSHCYMYSHGLVIFHTKMQTHICTQTHTVPCTRWRGTTTQRDSGYPDAHVCAWTSGGFYGSTLSSCYCANHPLVHSSEFKSSRVHRKNKICSPFHRWLTMHISQTFIYRSIYFLFSKNLYEIYHIYIAHDFFLKKQIFCSFLQV